MARNEGLLDEGWVANVVQGSLTLILRANFRILLVKQYCDTKLVRANSWVHQPFPMHRKLLKYAMTLILDMSMEDELFQSTVRIKRFLRYQITLVYP